MKELPALLGCVIALLVVGKLIYDRITPDPTSQSLNEAADRINKKLEATKAK